MIEFRNILCPIDLSELSVRPLRHAAALARWYNARLTVLHVVPGVDPMRSTPLGDPVHIVQPVPPDEEVVEALRRALQVAGVTTPDVETIAEAGDAVAAIIDRAVATPADLIVMGTHGRTGLDRLFVGSVAEQVLRGAPCPVLTVSPGAVAAPSTEVTFKRILCPVDFSPASLPAVGFALHLAKQADGAVTLLHAVEVLAEHEPAAKGPFAEYRASLITDAEERMRGLVADESRTWCEIEEVVVAGRAYRVILEAADAREAELIVMGAQGRGGVGLAVFGSTTQQVVRTAACPVLTVRG
ncbi:MAG TPA: universal stress protein [Vicinamibacterales bacterium]|nr:universal stress protein [Vicinamibacterales bacterium]